MKGLEALQIKQYGEAKQEFIVEEYKVVISKASQGGIHHPNKYITIIKNNLNVFVLSTMSSPAGCGSILIYNTFLSASFDDELVKIMQKIFQLFKDNGAGSVITMLGQNYYSTNLYKFLEAIGFKSISEYNNYRHGSTYKQKLLQLVL